MACTDSIVEQLATSRGRRDEAPNIELADRIVQNRDKRAIVQLVDLATSGAPPIRYDAIKALFETARHAPDLVLPHLPALLALLDDPLNRILWATLQILDVLTPLAPEKIMAELDRILDAADRSSVVAKDKLMSILTRLNADPRFAELVTPTILLRLAHAAPNQFPTYAENAAMTIGTSHRAELARIIKTRMTAIASPTRRKRLEKVLKKLG